MSLIQAFSKKIRRYGRKIFRPMTVDAAAEKKEILSIAYFLSSFMFFCYMNYSFFTYDDPLSKLKTEDRVRILMERRQIDAENVKVYKFKNFTKVEEFVINQNEKDHLSED